MVKYFILKLNRYINIRKAFKSLSFVLENGMCYIEGDKFFLIKNIGSHQRFSFKIKSKEKYVTLLKEGSFKITPYKYLLLGESVVYTVVRGKERFNCIQEKLTSYRDQLPYKTMECKFIGKRNLIISNVITGKQFNDDAHLKQFIEYYFKHINSKLFANKRVDMNGIKKEIVFYPQHGDCYSKNIFWNGSEPTLIDLDDVDLYPLFYDVFYHVIASKHEAAFKFFRNENFQTSVRRIFADKTNASDIVDLYLGAYVYFWVNKMERKMKFHEINFYLQWFEKADLSTYPNVLMAMETYRKNLKSLGIRR